MLEIPYPPKELSPNARVHFHQRARATKKYRELVGWNMRAKLESKEFPTNFKITFHPRNSLADTDNFIASFKAGQDGMQDALGINDRFFEIEYVMGEPVKGGKVIIEVVE